jgi:hypothetical protein
LTRAVGAGRRGGAGRPSTFPSIFPLALLVAVNLMLAVAIPLLV